MSKSDSESILMICIICFILFAGILFVSLIPNSPSFRVAGAEPDETNSPVRESLGFFTVTAYCPCSQCCGKWSDGMTTSGHYIQKDDRFCAADSMIPFGMKLDIPGYGFVPVFDRGKDIIGRKLDVFFSTHKEALEWGKQELEIHCWVEGD